MDAVLPLEQTDPELAEHIRQIVAGHENGAIRPPVRGFSASWRERIYILWARSALGYGKEVVRKSKLPGRNDACPCGSKIKFKRCCG